MSLEHLLVPGKKRLLKTKSRNKQWKGKQVRKTQEQSVGALSDPSQDV